MEPNNKEKLRLISGWPIFVLLMLVILSPWFDLFGYLAFRILFVPFLHFLKPMGGKGLIAFTLPFYAFFKAFLVILLGYHLAPAHKLKVTAVLFVIGMVAAYAVAGKGFNPGIGFSFWPEVGPILMAFLGGACGLIIIKGKAANATSLAPK